MAQKPPTRRAASMRAQETTPKGQEERASAKETIQAMVDAIVKIATGQMLPDDGYAQRTYRRPGKGWSPLSKRYESREGVRHSTWSPEPSDAQGDTVEVGFRQKIHQVGRIRRSGGWGRLVSSEVVYTEVLKRSDDEPDEAVVLTAVQEPPAIILGSTEDGTGELAEPGTPAWQKVEEIFGQLEETSFNIRIIPQVPEPELS